MADKMMRRVRSDLPWANDLNRWADTLLGNTPGRIKLWGDGGNELDLIDGTVVSANNYPLDVRSDVGYHERIRHSADTHDVWEVLDAGATLEGTLDATGNVTITGNQTVSGTLGVTGATTLGTLTVGGVATFNANAVFNVNVTLGDAAGDTITINGATTANANVTLTGSSVLTLPNGTDALPSLAIGDAGGLFRQAAGSLGFSAGGAERARLSSSGLILPAVPLVLGATVAATGDIRGTKDFSVQARDAANGADIQVIDVDGADNIVFGDVTDANTVYLAGSVAANLNVGGTNRIRTDTTGIGFFNTAPIAKPTVSGSRGGNAALADLLTELANLGLITDSTSA